MAHSDAEGRTSAYRHNRGRFLTKLIFFIVSVLLFLGVYRFTVPRGSCLTLQPSTETSIEPLVDQDKVTANDLSWTEIDSFWSDFAYSQYATTSERLCHSVMIFESLHRLGSKAERVLMYPEVWNSLREPASGRIHRLLEKAQLVYHVRLQPVDVLHSDIGTTTWADSFTKLLTFNLTQYSRVLHLDSDATILQNLDELFFSPVINVALPRAYWMDPKDRVLSSQLMLLRPSSEEFNRLITEMDSEIATFHGSDHAIGDMDIINDLYRDSALVLPHRPYNLLTGEFRAENHASYLGDPDEEWDADRIFQEAKYIHFSDWPWPKPWINPGSRLPTERPLKCVPGDCRDQEIWLSVYDDFRERRKRICSV